MTTEEQNLAWERGKNKTPIITCGCEKQNMAGSQSLWKKYREHDINNGKFPVYNVSNSLGSTWTVWLWSNPRTFAAKVKFTREFSQDLRRMIFVFCFEIEVSYD